MSSILKSIYLNQIPDEMKKFFNLQKIALLSILILAVSAIAYSGSSSEPKEKCLQMKWFYQVTTHPDGTYDAVLDSMCVISSKGGEITAKQLN